MSNCNTVWVLNYDSYPSELWNFGWCNFEYGMNKLSGHEIKSCVRIKRKGLEAEIIKFWIKTILAIYKIKNDW